VADGGGGIPVGGVEEVGVGPQGYAWVGMAEAAGDGPDANPASGQGGGREVAERMEGDVGQFEAVAQGAEGSRDAVGPVWRCCIEVL